MTIIGTVLGVIAAIVAVALFGVIALFYSCDRAADREKKRHENKENH